jgi:hypothetical protein
LEYDVEWWKPEGEKGRRVRTGKGYDEGEVVQMYGPAAGRSRSMEQSDLHPAALLVVRGECARSDVMRVISDIQSIDANE